MTNKSVSSSGYTINWVQPELISKISDSSAATEQIAVKLAGAAQRLWVRDIVLTSADATDTNNITCDFYVVEGDASADGGDDTTSLTQASWVGTSYFDTALAGIPQRIPVNYLGAVAEDLIVDITVAAGTPTVKFVAYYALI
jgi:hypothetical protein